MKAQHPFVFFALSFFLLTLPALGQSNFGSVNIGANVTQTVAVTILGTATLGKAAVLTEGAEGLDFTDAGGGTCTVNTGYTAGQSCTVKVNFKPRFARVRSGAVFAFDANGAPLGWTFLQGIGAGPQSSFLPPAITHLVVPGLKQPGSIAVDGGGNLYIADLVDNSVNKETLNAGDGSYTLSTVTAKTNSPATIAVDGAGNVYAAISGWGGFLFENPFGSGAYNGQYYETVVDLGAGISVSAVAVTPAGTIYVGDRSLPGSIGVGVVQADMSYKMLNGIPVKEWADWGNLTNLAVDGSGNVYALYATGNIVELANDGNWTETDIYGNFRTEGGTVVNNSMAVDMAGDVYFADSVTNSIYREGPGGQITVVNGTGMGTIEGLAVDAKGNLYFTTFTAGSGGSVYKVDFSAPPSMHFNSTAEGVTSADSPRSVIVENPGNQVLTLSSVSFPADFPVGNAAVGNCAVSTPLSPAQRCSLSVTFKPTAGSSGAKTQDLMENVVVVSNAMNIAGTTQRVSVWGTETGIVNTTGIPVFTPPAGTYNRALQVTMTSATTGATIYYTTDGKTAPTSASTKYTGAIAVGSNATIKAIAVSTGLPNSPIATGVFTFLPYVAQPTFTPAAGAYYSVQLVAIKTANAGATFYYTTDGVTKPTSASTKYTVPIRVAANMTIQAFGVLTGAAPSTIGSASYTIIGSPDVLAAPASGIATPKATVNAVVNTNGLAGSYFFECWTGANPAKVNTPKTTLGASKLPVSISAQLSNLASKTKYYCQAAATTPAGTASGAVLSFTTN